MTAYIKPTPGGLYEYTVCQGWLKYVLGVGSPSLTHSYCLGGEDSVIGSIVNGKKITRIAYGK